MPGVFRNSGNSPFLYMWLTIAVLIMIFALFGLFSASLFNVEESAGKQGKERYPVRKPRGGAGGSRRGTDGTGRKAKTDKGWPQKDERINGMLAECRTLLEGMGVPVSKSICPKVTITSSRSCWGRCCRKGSLKKYTDYDFYIEISGRALQCSEKTLRNTLIHELLHTVPDGMRHTGEWKKWARYVSARTEYTIQRVGGDKSDEDKMRFISAC